MWQPLLSTRAGQMVTEQAGSLDETTRKAFAPSSSVCVGGGFPALPSLSLVLAECPTI